MVPVKDGVALWWCYAAQAVLQQKTMCYRFAWEKIKHLCHLLRRCVQLYVDSLQGSDKYSFELKEIEKDLHTKVIMLWRFLAHAKVESVKSKEVAEQRILKKRDDGLLGI